MKIRQLVEKYITNTQQAFQQIMEKPLSKDAKGVLEYTKRYFADAKYYHNQKRFETALASIAYCEGLLDALRLLKMVEFQWPVRNE